MNKIFVNNKPLYLLTNIGKAKLGKDNFHIAFSSVKELKKTIQIFENDGQYETMTVLFLSDAEKKKAMFSTYKVIEAAGGLVKNKEQKILFIFRLGKWDLPKGKIEKDENPEEAALREVHEECGLSRLKIRKKLPSTYHTYDLKNEKILKISHWFEMSFAGGRHILVPQLEEGITEVRWLSADEIKEAMKNTYASITDVISYYFSK